MHPLLDVLRAAELEAAVEHFPPAPAFVLEIGAGSGWQSSLLRSQGYEVMAVDVQSAEGSDGAPVLPMDGVRLPFAPSSFDVAFSSNVLEHVVDLPGLLTEIDRVVRPTGRSVHIMPTPTWRVLTILTFYLTAPRRTRQWMAARRIGPSPDASRPPAGADPDRQRPAVARLRRFARAVLHEPPHGEFRSSVAEVWQYRAAAWRARLSGRVVEESPVGIVYTGYGWLPRLSLGGRRRLARLVGSSCRVYVVASESAGR